MKRCQFIKMNLPVGNVSDTPVSSPHTLLVGMLLLILGMLCLQASPCFAVTYFETFDHPPSDWTAQNSIGGYFDWHFSGWLDVETIRDTETARFTRPIPISFTSFSVTEFWFEYDVQVLSGDSNNFLQFGLFDSNADNTANSVGTSTSVDRINPAFWLSNGSIASSPGAVLEPPYTVRVKGHFKGDVSEMGDLVISIYDISDYNNQVLVGTYARGISSTSIDVTKWDLFGLGNSDDAIFQGHKYSRLRLDNLYFSTSGANPSPVAPSFHDHAYIYERFNTNPEERGWMVTETDSSKFYWDAWNGWLNAHPKRETSTARFVRPVTTGFTSFSTAEFWFGFDLQVQTGNFDNVIMRGLFDSSQDNTTNSMGSLSSGNRNDVTCWYTSGSIAYTPGMILTPPYTVRVIGHFKEDHDGSNDMTISVYDLLDLDANGCPALLATVKDDWGTGNVDVMTLDLFGIGNRDDRNASATGNSRYDNLYFSTTLPYPANASLPTFVASESGILDLTARAEMDSLAIKTEVGNASGALQNLKVLHRVYLDCNPSNPPFIDETSASMVIPAGMTLSHDFVKTGISPELWSPHSPTLYLLRTQILDANNGDSVLYTKDTKIGFRTFEVSGKNFHLNGKPVYLRGYVHIDAGPLPTSVTEDPDFIESHFTNLKNMNLNWVRAIGYSESWIDAMDERGFMAVGGSYTGGGSRDPEIWFRSFKQAWRELYRFRNNPSIIMWCLGNEWHIDDAAMSTSAKKVYDRINSLDPSRLKFNSWAGGKYDSFFPDTDPAVSIGSDFLSYHRYTGWYGGDWSFWYELYNNANYPCTVNECVGSGTERSPIYSGFTTRWTKVTSAGLRAIGQAYDWNTESKWYTAYNARGTLEEQRRGRGRSNSMCGALVFSNSLYEFPYYHNSSDKSVIIKPIVDALTQAYEPLHISIRTRFPNQFAGADMPVDFIIMNDDVSNWYPSIPASTLHVQLLNPSATSVWTASYSVSEITYYSSWKRTLNIAIPSDLTSEGVYHVAAQLEYNNCEIASTMVSVFIAPKTWVEISHSASSNIAVYDSESGSPTIKILDSLSVPLTEITNFDSLSGYDSLIIGYNSFDTTVTSAESAILSFINSGKRVLILQQRGSTQRSALNTSNWLGTSISTGLYNTSFVNIVRQTDPTLMNGLKPNNFRSWNSTQPDLPFTPYVSGGFFRVSDSDMSSKVAVLANTSHSLNLFSVIEIFPNNGTGGSCILSQLNLVNAQYMADPLALKFLSNLVDYTAESRPHYKNVTVDKKIVFGDFESEKGIFWSGIQQGMTIGGTPPFYTPDGRDFRGKMRAGHLGTFVVDNLDDVQKCPLYIRAPFSIGDSDVKVDVENKNENPLEYRLIFNGTVADPGWVSVPPGSRGTSRFTLPSLIPSGSDIKLQIEAEVGFHAEIHKGLKFYSIQLAVPPIDDRSLVTHYPFDGDPNDVTGMYNGTVVGPVTWQTGADPDTADSIYLGGNTYVNCGDVPLSRAATTIAYWMKADVLAHMNPFNKMPNDDSGGGLRIGVRDNGTSRLWTGSHIGNNSYDVTEADTGVTYAAGEWTHHAWVFENNTIRFYVDGLLRTTKSASREINAAGVPFEIGAFHQVQGFRASFRGCLDDVRVYNVALMGEQIRSLPGLAVNLCAGNLLYDLTGDCEVDLNDFTVLASGWLVLFDLSDFAMMASEWLEFD